MTPSWWLLVTMLTLGGMCMLAYALRALDLMGAACAFVLGLLIALLAGLAWLVPMVAFVAVAFVATRLGFASKSRRGLAEGIRGERGAGNVLGNGAAAALAVLALRVPFVPTVAVQLAFATAVASVAADTLASEIGVLSRRARRIVLPFARAQPGENGAVSWLGQAAAAVGAVGIALVAIPSVGVPSTWAWVPAVGGFVGCQIDSVLGATLERTGPPRPGSRPLSKQDVNFLASGLAAAIVGLAFTVRLGQG